jgi:hypothetical protein
MQKNIHMELMPLRIPGLWWVVKNDFYDVDPELRDGILYPSGIFIEDILSIQRHNPWGGVPIEHDYVLDLGWYPDQDPQGRYRLVVLRHNWEKSLCAFESRERVAVRDTMEHWMDLATRAPDEDSLRKWLQKAK